MTHFMLSPDDPGAGGGSTPPPVVAPVAGVTPATDPVAAFRKEQNDKMAELRHETKALREEIAGVRGLKDAMTAFIGKFGGLGGDGGGTPPVTAVTPPLPGPSAPVQTGPSNADLAKKYELMSVYADHGVKPGPVRDAIEEAAQFAPAEKVRGLAEKMIAIQSGKPLPVSPPAPSTDTGAPAGATGLLIPDNPLHWPQSYVDSLTNEEVKTKWDAYVRKQGGFVHPFAAAKAAARTGGNDDALVQRLAAALKK